MATIKKDKNTNKWYFRVYYTDPEETGRRRYKSKMEKGFDTKREAEIAANELEYKLNTGNTFKAEHIIFSEYFATWCKNHKLGKFTMTTEKQYLREMKYVEEFFGDLKLSELNRQKYQEYINLRGKGNGKATVQKVHGSLKACVKQALADGLITIDPSYGISINYDNENSGRVKYWNQKETNKLIEYLKANINQRNTMLFIAISTGLRIGEIYALSWNSFNFKDKTLKVEFGYDYKQTKDFTNAKNESSKRTLVITDTLIEYIGEYKNKYEKDYPEYLFLDDKKPCISHNHLLRYLKKTCEELGIDQLTIHNLRHTHCSLLIYKEITTHYISKRLGHKNIIETLNTYSHIIDEMEQKQDDKIKKALESLNM